MKKADEAVTETVKKTRKKTTKKAAAENEAEAVTEGRLIPKHIQDAQQPNAAGQVIVGTAGERG